MVVIEISVEYQYQRAAYMAMFGKCRWRSASSILCELSSPSENYPTSQPVMLPVLNHSTMSPVPLVTCPLKHMTHVMLACDRVSVCRSVDNSGEWYDNYCRMPLGLNQPYFYCTVEREFIPYSLLCDFKKDCSGGHDEDFCVHPLCKAGLYNCGQGQCVDYQKHCDGYKDCKTNLDEADCHDILPPNYVFITPPAVVNFDKPGGFTVTPLLENNMKCPDTHFLCPDSGYCLPVYVRCNGVNDCPGHEDELQCSFYTCPGFYRCRGSDSTICVHVNHLCDGRPQCPQHDDELMCDMTCPEPCTCNGLAFSCIHIFQVSSFPQLRYLEARGSEISQADITNNNMLIHLGVQACGWNNLTHITIPNLHSLDLSDNFLRHVNFTQFASVQYLRRLSLAGNPLSGGFSNGQIMYLLPLLVVFNISRVQVQSLNMSILSAVMPDLQILDLSQTGINSMKGQHLFHNLRILDLQGCPLSDFTLHFMKSMKLLKFVFGDNFKLCCSAVLPDAFHGTCVAPPDEISSCDDLLKSSIYRSALAVFAVLATLGNLGSFLYRLFSSVKIKFGFVVFVHHLCVSDFLMGMYLAVIGMADKIYAGVYVWSEVAWKESAACTIAGFLSFLSSEVSAFLICVITLDRFLVLQFPFSQIRFGAMSAHIACVIIWTLGLTLATVPLLPLMSNWKFYRHTGICIPLPVTRADFAGHSYSFSIIIVCNLILFLVIAVGQSLIYWSVRSSVMSTQFTEIKNNGSQSVKSKEAVIARRLLSIAISDFLCWFPIGLCGVMAAFDVAIPGEVSVALVIFVLPLNSALNPFLYILNIILEKRQKAQELRFQKICAQLKTDSACSASM